MRSRTQVGAFRLLTYILYGQYSYMEVSRGVVHLSSIRKLARLLGTESKRVNAWLGYLEFQGYISGLSYSANRRQCQFKVRFPSNVHSEQ